MDREDKKYINSGMLGHSEQEDVNEEFNYDSSDEYSEEDINDLTIETVYKHIDKKCFVDNFKGIEGAVYIMPNGDILDASKLFELDAIHGDVGLYVFEHEKCKVEDDDYNYFYEKISDKLEFDLGMLRGNFGGGASEDRCYITITKQPTQIQWNRIQEFIDHSYYDLHEKELICYVEVRGFISHVFNLNKTTSEEIVKSLKRAIVSGILVESKRKSKNKIN